MLPSTEWLHLAKRLAVGMTLRVRHRDERRPNMVVGNERDKWWAYCQACKEGGVVDKEHVRLGESIRSYDNVLHAPVDGVPVIGSPYEGPVARFLAKKHMDFMYLPEGVLYSPSRKRILVPSGYDDSRLMGRDITDTAPAKWLAYAGQKFLGQVVQQHPVVVVEDAFSYYKVQYALKTYDLAVACICALGTSVTAPLMLELFKAKHAVWMFDGDAAGYLGAARGHTRCRGIGLPSTTACAPTGLDPKDMECSAIAYHITDALKRSGYEIHAI